jgi:hypothetical protein
MEPSRPFDPRVLALGRRLVEALREDGRDDPISAWMAHHIAGLMVTAESTTSAAERTESQARCMDAILKLWDHRGTLPGKARPFGKAQAALDFFAKLDPHSTESLFFRMRPPKRPGTPPQGDWLAKAETVDSAARTLVMHCLEHAFREDASELKAWVELAPQVDPNVPHFDVDFAAAIAGLGGNERAEIERGAEQRLVAKLDVMLNELKTLRDQLNSHPQG